MLKVFYMIKFSVLTLFLTLSLKVFAEAPCDLRPGLSIGIRVVEFTSGNTVHSKMPMRQSTADALLEEMINLQDMGVCEEKITAQKCILKFEKIRKNNYISLFRDNKRWNSWSLKSKEQAQNYVIHLKRVGFCS